MTRRLAAFRASLCHYPPFCCLLFSLLLFGCLLYLAAGPATAGTGETARNGADAGHGVILLYHRIAAEGPGSTRVAPARFEAHLDALVDGGYRVLPLAELLAGARAGKLPPRAVALTFDDAYRSILVNAFPPLAERGLPFTVFVATGPVDGGFGSYLAWDELRQLADSGLATFGGHSVSHAHLEAHRSGEDDAGWRSRVRGEILDSLARLRAELGDAVIDAHAHPYGEYSRATEALLASEGLWGLAQQSGAVGPESRATRVPRFPLYHGADGDARLRTALAARPLETGDEADPRVFLLPGEASPERWRFRPLPGPWREQGLACYGADGTPLTLARDGAWVEVTLPAFRPGRNKVNCTAPAGGGGHAWLSRLWIRADAAGTWLRE
jgi:peptidoglycan/xylan/chitin deacetylase (PgdA/CDA1 family)